MSNPRSVLITGATGLIGEALVTHFLRAGRTVIAISRRKDRLAALRTKLGGYPGELQGFDCDLAAPNGAADLITRLAGAGLHPAAIVNNARDIANLTTDAAGEATRAGLLAEFTLGVVAAYELVMASANQPGSELKAVVNVASMYGVVTPNRNLYQEQTKQPPLNYGIAKAALIQLTKELAARLADRSIRVNAVSFGGVAGRADREFAARYGRLCPQRRMLDVAEVAGPVEFLLSDAATGATGHNLMVDGGWTLW